jgi:regulator of protease activity HflC (stomatin/prohibitin superfamily)
MLEFGMGTFWTFFIFFLVFVVVYASYQVVPEAAVRLVERLGKYQRTLRPGIRFIIPFFEKVKIADITTYDKDPISPEKSAAKMRFLVNNKGDIPLYEIIMDPPPIDAISKDNSIVYPDSLLYFRIVDPVKAVYQIENLGNAIYNLLQTTLRQEIGVLDSDDIIVGREEIGGKVKVALEEAAAAWGTTITRVEIEEIRFDEDVTQALSDQRAAELKGRAIVAESQREKEAAIVESEGVKRSAIIRAEGEKQKVVLAAEAKFEQEKLEAEADFLKASRVLEGQAKGTEALARALEKNPSAIVSLEALKAQIQVADAIGRSDNTLIIPETTAGLFGAIKSIEKIMHIKADDKIK